MYIVLYAGVSSPSTSKDSEMFIHRRAQDPADVPALRGAGWIGYPRHVLPAMTAQVLLLARGRQLLPPPYHMHSGRYRKPHLASRDRVGGRVQG